MTLRPEDVLKAAAVVFAVSPDDLRGQRRSVPLVHYRQAAMAAARDLTGHSYPSIAAVFDNRDHTTVIHACRRRYEDAAIAAYTQQIVLAVTAHPTQPTWTVGLVCPCGSWSRTIGLAETSNDDDHTQARQLLVNARNEHQRRDHTAAAS